VGSIPSVFQCKIYHEFSPLRGDLSLRVCEHVGVSLFMVYTAQSHCKLPCRSRVLVRDTVHVCPSPGVGRNYAVQVLPCQTMTAGLHGQVNPPTQTRLQGKEFVMNLALRYGGNQTHAGASSGLIRSRTFNHSANRVYTIGTKHSRNMIGTFGTNCIHMVGRVVKV